MKMINKMDALHIFRSNSKSIINNIEYTLQDYTDTPTYWLYVRDMTSIGTQLVNVLRSFCKSREAQKPLSAINLSIKVLIWQYFGVKLWIFFLRNGERGTDNYAQF